MPKVVLDALNTVQSHDDRRMELLRAIIQHELIIWHNKTANGPPGLHFVNLEHLTKNRTELVKLNVEDERRLVRLLIDNQDTLSEPTVMLLECRLDFLNRQTSPYFRFIENIGQRVRQIGAENSEHGKVLMDLVREAMEVMSSRAVRPVSKKPENSRFYNPSYDQNLRELKIAGEQEYQRVCRLADTNFINMLLTGQIRRLSG